MNQPAIIFSLRQFLLSMVAACLLSIGHVDIATAQPPAPLLFLSGGKAGYKDATGKTIIAPQFGMAGSFSEGLANAQSPVTGKFGFIDAKGSWKIAADFEAAGDFTEGLARVQQQGKWGYINKSGQWKITAQFQLCYEFTQGYAIAQKAGKWGIIDTKGNWIVTAAYYDITPPAHGWYAAKATVAEPWKLYKTGQPAPVNEFVSGKMKAFTTGGLAPARDATDKWGLVDTTGKWIVAPQFSNLEPLAEGLAAAEKDYTSWGYIDATGKWIIAPTYDRAGNFRKGVALVEKGNQVSYITPTGQLLFSFNR